MGTGAGEQNCTLINGIRGVTTGVADAIPVLIDSWGQLGGPIRIGSKSFTESYVLAEIALRQVRETGPVAVHRPGMGGTIVLWQALRSGGIDAYPDYSGTIREQILAATADLSPARMRDELAEVGVGMTDSLGFENTYALVMRRAVTDVVSARFLRSFVVPECARNVPQPASSWLPSPVPPRNLRVLRGSHRGLRLNEDRIEFLDSWKSGHTGFSVHNAVAVRAEDPDGLERLARYLLRPPLSLERLRLEPGLALSALRRGRTAPAAPSSRHRQPENRPGAQLQRLLGSL